MAFAIHKSNDPRTGAKRSPLAGWLGKKPDADDGEIPALDVTAGVNRALRGNQVINKKEVRKEATNPAREALSAIEAALYAIDGIRDTLEQACEIAISAKDVKDVGGRALLAESYDELRLSIDKVIETADPRAAALIGDTQRHLDVKLGGKTRYSVSPMPMTTGERGLCLSPPRDAFATFDEIEVTLEELDRALGRADRAAASYCRDAQYLIARMDVDHDAA